jgi:hypothetical protein
MKKLLFLCIYFITLISNGHGFDEPFRAFIRIEKTAHSLKIKPTGTGPSIPAVGYSHEVSKKISKLEDGSEAVIDGFIRYTYRKTEGTHQSQPIIMIQDIHPVSFKDLGVGPGSITADQLPIRTTKSEYIPPSIPITTEVASAMTLTTSLLLMNELTSANTSYSLDKDLRTTLFLSTGLMATIVLIYDQIQGKNKP